MNLTKDEVLKLGAEHHVDGCLSHNLRLLAFANAIADAQREKDAEYVQSFGYGIEGDMFKKLATAIRANKE